MTGRLLLPPLAAMLLTAGMLAGTSVPSRAEVTFAGRQAELPVDVRQFPGAPLEVTYVGAYREKTEWKYQTIVCVSFRVTGDRALSAVKFAFADKDFDWKEHYRTTLLHRGTFTPGVEIQSYTGRYAIPDAHGRSNCTEMNPYRMDAPILTVRLIEAAFADGTTWTAPAADLPAPKIEFNPTPSPSASSSRTPS
jgi:hypothetical protein